MNAVPIRLSIEPSKLSRNTILTSFFPFRSLHSFYNILQYGYRMVETEIWGLRIIIIIFQYGFNPICFAYGIHSHYIETYFTDFQFVPLGNLFLLSLDYSLMLWHQYTICVQCCI